MPHAEHHRLDDFIRGVIRSYRRTLTADRRRLLERFRYVHLARKVVGVGSVGTRAWIMLLLGRDGERPAVPAVQGGGGVGARAVPRQEPVRQPRPAGRRGPAADAGGQRHHARLDPRPPTSMARSRHFYIRQLWDAEGLGPRRAMDPRAMTVYARALRPDAGQGARALRRRDRDRELSRQGPQLRPRAGVVRGDLRRPERARLPGSAGGRRLRPRHGRVRPLRAASQPDSSLLGDVVRSVH